jgi:hypothetical protein
MSEQWASQCDPRIGTMSAENDRLRTLNAELLAAKFSRIVELESEIKKFVAYNEEAWAVNAELMAALQFVIDFKITDSNQEEVAEDSLHEIRKRARATIAKAGARE